MSQASPDADEPLGEEETAAGLNGPTFTPRLYRQRYERAAQLLKEYLPNGRADLLIDFGTAEAKFIRLITSSAEHRLNEVGHFVGVDLDRQLLISHGRDNLASHAGRFQDFCLLRRRRQLETSLYVGDLTVFDPRFANVDVITAIEVVEHLEEPTLKLFAESVFGRYRPQLVLVTTPNRDFNVLFPQLEEGKWRHWDHKFEWTRAEFVDWCDGIVKSYPDYEIVVKDGVGYEPGREDLGPCSQIVLFQIKPHLWPSIKSSKSALLKPLVRPTKQCVVRLTEDGEFQWDSTFTGPQEEQEESQLYKAVYHHKWDWNPLAPDANRVIGAIRMALSDLLCKYEEAGREEREMCGNREGFYVSMTEVTTHPQVAKYCTDPEVLRSFFLARLSMEEDEEFILSNDANSFFLTTYVNYGDEDREEEEEELDPWKDIPLPPISSTAALVLDKDSCVSGGGFGGVS